MQTVSLIIGDILLEYEVRYVKDKPKHFFTIARAIGEEKSKYGSYPIFRSSVDGKLKDYTILNLNHDEFYLLIAILKAFTEKSPAEFKKYFKRFTTAQDLVTDAREGYIFIQRLNKTLELQYNDKSDLLVLTVSVTENESANSQQVFSVPLTMLNAYRFYSDMLMLYQNISLKNEYGGNSKSKTNQSYTKTSNQPRKFVDF